MKVAQVRGTTLRAWDLANYLPAPGVETEWFLSRANAAMFADAGITIHPLRSPGDAVSKLPPYVQVAKSLVAGSSERLYGLERAVDGFDIVHTVESYFPITDQAVRARDAGRCRAVVCTVMENIAFWRPQNASVARRLARITAGVDRFVAITERAALHLETAGASADRITVMPVGVDTELFKPAERARPAAAPLRVLTVSRLERGKGVEDLATAVGLLSRRGVRVEVTYVGQGPSRGAIEDIGRHYGVSSQLSFTGGIPWQRLHEVHADHDLFVLASAPTSNWREQFGYAVVEAMASGLPALVGDSGSLMEVVGRRDALVTPHDPLSLADRLAELADAPEQRAELAAFNRARVLERFDAGDVRGRLADLYRAVLD